MRPRIKEATLRDGKFYLGNRVLDVEIVGLAGVVGDGYRIDGKIDRKELRRAIAYARKDFPNADYYVTSEPENSDVSQGMDWGYKDEERAYGVLFLAGRNKQEAEK